jgi:CheY-like chemotaxis protein
MAKQSTKTDAVTAGRPESSLILVADGNTGRAQRVLDACTTAGFPCRLAPHGASALEIALAVQPAVLVAQLDLPLVDALKLAEILRANPRTKSTRFLFLGGGDSLGARGAVGDRLLPVDTRPNEIVANIEDILERKSRIDHIDASSAQGGAAEGTLHETPLADLLQSLLLHRRSGRLVVMREGESGDEIGRLLIRDGDIIQADVGQVDGEKALFRLLAWSHGHFEFEAGPRNEPPVILAPTRRLLVEGLRQLEESDRMATRLPQLDSPVRLTVKNSELPNIVHPLTQEVLLLLELYTTVREVVDHCAYPDYQVLRTLHTLAERGIVTLGRVPLPAPVPAPAAEAGLFTEAQARRLRDWLRDAGSRPGSPQDARLLVVSSTPGAASDFARLLQSVSGAEVAAGALEPETQTGQLVSMGRVALEDDLGIELVHLPADAGWEAFWPVAGHGALGTLFLLESPVGEAAARVEPVASSLARQPRARTFHVVLLGKDDRISPDELRENLSLIDEASLFLLPIQQDKDRSALVRSLFARVMP